MQFDIGKKVMKNAVNEQLDKLEKRADKFSGCIASQRELDILKENIEEVYSKTSSQAKRFKKLKERSCGEEKHRLRMSFEKI